MLRVEVTGPHKAGSAIVNVTVKPEQKVNTPPVAVIKPSILNVKEDTTGILDGAGECHFSLLEYFNISHLFGFDTNRLNITKKTATLLSGLIVCGMRGIGKPSNPYVIPPGSWNSDTSNSSKCYTSGNTNETTKKADSGLGKG